MLTAALLCFSLVLPIQEETPTAQGYSDQAWQLVPTYTGNHRAYLSPELESEVQAAARLLEAGLALEADNVLCLWRLGHVESLLAENCRNRGRKAEAKEHIQSAMDALALALEKKPGDPWNSYAMGIACTNAGDHERALTYLANAVSQADAEIASDENSNSAWLRRKVMEWQSTVAMRAQRSDEARAFMRTYNEEFIQNEWVLQTTLAESYSRQWDLEKTREAYALARDVAPEDSGAHSLIGYVEGLLGHEELAYEHVLRGIQLEREPGLYSRLWLNIFAKGQQGADAAADLQDLLENPPESAGAWDISLCRFVMSEGTPADFIAAGKAEVARRIVAGELVDDLMCEVYFYAGLRIERQNTSDQANSPGDLTARGCYRLALQEMPATWKWEWAYSRKRLAGLTGAVEPEAPAFSIKGDQFSSSELQGTILAQAWSAPLQPRQVPTLGRKPQVGDIFQATIRDAQGKISSVVHVVGASSKSQ